MLRTTFTIACISVMIAVQANAQTSNPFDLKWKSGEMSSGRVIDSGSTVDVAPAPPADSFSMPVGDSSDNAPEMAAIEEDVTLEAITSPDDTTGFLPEEDDVPHFPIEEFDSASISGDEGPTITESPGEIPEEFESESEPEEEISTPILPGPTRNVGVLLIITMLGLSVLVLTWAVNANRGFIRKIFRAAMNANLSALLLREQKFASLQYLYYIVYATFFINTSLFLFLISRYSSWNIGDDHTPLLLFLAVLVGIYLSRHLFMRVLGSTFRIETETTHYNFNILLYNILAGIALIPVNLFLAFGPETMRIPVIYTGLGLIGLLYLLRQLRGINIASHLISGHVFHFFVYLCAVEILPVLVLFKYFITD